MIITGFYSALLAVILVGLSIHIIKLRIKYRIGLGDGDNKHLRAAIRVHGNFTEFVPMVLILFAIAEYHATSAVILHALGSSFILARLAHVIALHKTAGTSSYRQFGILVTFAVLIILAIINFYAFILSGA